MEEVGWGNIHMQMRDRGGGCLGEHTDTGGSAGHDAAVAAKLRVAHALVALGTPEPGHAELGDRGGAHKAVDRGGNVPAVGGISGGRSGGRGCVFVGEVGKGKSS